MKVKTFKRGVHANPMKYLSENKKVTEVVPKSDMVYPLSQHIGAPAIPIVEVGEKVLLGQKIAKAASFVSCNIFSAVSGTVKAIEPRTTTMGETCNSIIIENDGKFDVVEEFAKPDNYTEFSRDQIIAKIQEAGIVGLGGAGFPTHVKLSPKEPEKIEYVIINAAECEPYLTSDYRLIHERTQDFIEGISILSKLFPNAKCIVGIEENKPSAIRQLYEHLEVPSASVCVLKAKYPQGGERMLIKAVTGRELNSSMLPSDVGCIVVNVATTVAITEAVVYSIPLIKRVMTVTGDAVVNPGNFLVSVGTNHQEILDAAGGFKSEPEKIISGGPMMGTSLFSLDLPVTKTSASILAMLHDDVAKQDTTACIHCGGCVHVCPERLVPQLLMEASDFDEYERFEKLGGMECIECGCCTYVCPAKRPLTQSFKFAKRKVQAIRRKKKEMEEKK